MPTTVPVVTAITTTVHVVTAMPTTVPVVTAIPTTVTGNKMLYELSYGTRVRATGAVVVVFVS